MIFYGFKSRCIILCACIWAKPRSNPLIKVFIYSFVNDPFFLNYFYMYLLNFIEKWTSFKNFQHNVNRVLWFKNTLKLQNIWMVKSHHNWEFIHQTLFAIFSSKCILFWKGLHSESSQICYSLNFIYWSEISLA